jgi:hypothetical protein
LAVKLATVCTNPASVPLSPPSLATNQPLRPHNKIVFPSTNFPFFPFQTANDTNDRQQTKINITLYTSSLQINSKIPIQTSNKATCTPTARLNTGAYAPLRKPTMQGMWLLQSIAANFFILGKPPLLPTQATMAIATHSLNKHHLSQKAQQAKTTTHRGGNRRSEHHLDKSPKSVNINAIIVDINLPQTRFETILTALRPAAEGGNKMEKIPMTMTSTIRTLWNHRKRRPVMSSHLPPRQASITSRMKRIAPSSRTMAKKNCHRQEYVSARHLYQPTQTEGLQHQPPAGD